MSTRVAGPVTVFIAEDNPILLQGLERALTANGYHVKTAIDGQRLIELLNDSPLPDLLLLDVMMPGMTGIEVLDAVRDDPRTADLPVMLITAAADEAVAGSELDARDVDLLMKPFRLNQLLARIEENVGFPAEENARDAETSLGAATAPTGG
ncbi:MAG: response regulator [Gemmatimonadota bacterium]